MSHPDSHPFDNAAPIFRLDPYARGRRSGNANAARAQARARAAGNGKKPGDPQYSRTDPNMVAVDGPSPDVPRYRSCDPGCRCPRCTFRAHTFAQQYAACAPFREMAW